MGGLRECVRRYIISPVMIGAWHVGKKLFDP